MDPEINEWSVAEWKATTEGNHGGSPTEVHRLVDDWDRE